MLTESKYNCKLNMTDINDLLNQENNFLKTKDYNSYSKILDYYSVISLEISRISRYTF